jgi:histidinol-phosphate/aromatic aminotransferase/cobyric acid decarboxylase-like protein
MSPPREHGGLVAEELARLGLRPEEVIDFSVNVNPYGPSPAVLAAARSAPIDRYPDPTASELRQEICRRHELPADAVVVGNGAADLLWTLARVLARPGEAVLVVEPAFAEFRSAVASVGAEVIDWRASPATQFAIDTLEIERLAQRAGARVLYLCSPGSPTGSHVPVGEVAALASRQPRLTVILDQAFLTLSEHHAEAQVPVPPNVVRVRSLTKDHAIPGLRLGYLLAAPALARRIEAARPPWTTSAVAQAAGLAALREDAFIDDCRQRLLADRRALESDLGRLGLQPVPSCTGFLAVAVEDGQRLRDRLLARRILVRSCASFGLPRHIRIAARPAGDRDKLHSALAVALARGALAR